MISHRHRIACAAQATLAFAAMAGFARGAEPAPPLVEYNRDVRPILSDNCFRCHGPDSASRQAELRLDRRDSAISERDGVRAIAPGKPGESELLRRIASDDLAERMPPADAGERLSARQVEVLRRWIEQGAEYQPHWSLISPQAAPPPEVRQREWPKNAIDRFILHRLEQEQLAPSPEAERTVLLRRASLDLTGLPPTLDELDAFLADTADDAYERAVDRLLASPRYGERMALDWLDLARYADTNGYFSDLERQMWRWRDWVIDAFNRNQPFDEFTVEQLAGARGRTEDRHGLQPQPSGDERERSDRRRVSGRVRRR